MTKIKFLLLVLEFHLEKNGRQVLCYSELSKEAKFLGVVRLQAFLETDYGKLYAKALCAFYTSKKTFGKRLQLLDQSLRIGFLYNGGVIDTKQGACFALL